ncbi:BSD domain-containing protein 1-like [Salvia hispanica]|uniref:BSD domain-containing protein 1-like n=1 Tax=Salvia hispanica TaxID=49212 RepID=UPI0020091BFD|nr:BSD domain-containing protein 1-like [Salvia hispanica]
MNFVKSIISDGQEAPTSESDPDSSGGTSNPNDAADAWSFGGFIRSVSMQSESVIESYRKDLQEFGSGLKKETEILRDTASRAVKDLPSSLDVVLKSTVSIINKEALRLSSDGEPEALGANRALNSGRYSRFEAQLSAMQSDLNTFCVEPEDAADYGKWKLGFELGDYEDPIEGLIGEDGILEGAYSKAVPNVVDRETFWCRYFYRVEKLKQQEKMRASIVKMAVSNDEEEDLSWDVDGDDNDADDGGGGVASDEKCKGKTEAAVVDGEKGNVIELSKKSGVDEGEGESGIVDGDEKVGVEEVVVSNHDDMGWDELGDVGSGDEGKTSAAGGGGSPKKEDIRKRLVVEDDDDDDLNWGIEDDDEPLKA